MSSSESPWSVWPRHAEKVRAAKASARTLKPEFMKLLVALLDSLWLSLELSLHGEQVSSLGTLVERVGAFLGLRSGAALFLGIAGALLVSLLNETCLETGAPSSLSCADSSDAGSFSRLSRRTCC